MEPNQPALEWFGAGRARTWSAQAAQQGLAPRPGAEDHLNRGPPCRDAASTVTVAASLRRASGTATGKWRSPCGLLRAGWADSGQGGGSGPAADAFGLDWSWPSLKIRTRSGTAIVASDLKLEPRERFAGALGKPTRVTGSRRRTVPRPSGWAGADLTAAYGRLSGPARAAEKNRFSSRPDREVVTQNRANKPEGLQMRCREGPAVDSKGGERIHAASSVGPEEARA